MSEYKSAQNILFICFLLLFSNGIGFTQTVKTLPVKRLNGPNGFALDSAGKLYVANEPGKQVIKIINDSTAENVISSDSPNGLDFDDKGNLYIINFFSGIVLRKRNLSIDTFAKGLDKPADIKWDGKGNLYVSEYETGSIKKIALQGQTTEFVNGFNHPFGLAFDNDGNLYVANNTTGVINKITPLKAVTFFAQIPGAVAYIAFSKKTGKLYAPCFTCNNIYAVSKEGKVELLSGRGTAGYKNGALSEAQFEGPNSVVISRDGDLYISEFPVNRIRKIIKVE